MYLGGDTKSVPVARSTYCQKYLCTVHEIQSMLSNMSNHVYYIHTSFEKMFSCLHTVHRGFL